MCSIQEDHFELHACQYSNWPVFCKIFFTERMVDDCSLVSFLVWNMPIALDWWILSSMWKQIYGPVLTGRLQSFGYGCLWHYGVHFASHLFYWPRSVVALFRRISRGDRSLAFEFLSASVLLLTHWPCLMIWTLLHNRCYLRSCAYDIHHNIPSDQL